MPSTAKSSPRSDLLVSRRPGLPYFFRLCLFGLLALFPLTVPPTDAVDPCNSMVSEQSCFCATRMVTCTNTKLPAIPHNFPANTGELNINGNRFPFPILRRSNISYLVELKRLVLKDCGIERLEVGVFSNLKKLTFLDLTSNNIKLIQAYTFQGVNLKYLILNKNRGIRLQRHSFAGMKVQRLSLEHSELKEVEYKTFLPLNKTLIGLWLDNNNLRTLDPRFERLCSHLKYFKVDNNPLRCGCQLRWLVSYLKRQHEKQMKVVSMSMENPPKCATPLRLLGREIRSILPHELVCDPPQLRNVEVLLEEARRGRLVCKAEGYPTPAITWSRIYPSRKFLQTFPPPLTHYGSSSRQVNQADVGIVGSTNYEEYLCTADNDGGQTNLTVRLRWVESALRPATKTSGVPGISGSGAAGKLSPDVPKDREPVYSTGNGLGRRQEMDRSGRDRERDRMGGSGSRANGGINRRFDEDVTEQNVFFRKQFTLLELIGAVIGTFTGTLGLFLLIYCFIRCSKKKDKKPTFSQYMYESAYSGSHEYDVPRIDHGAPPFVPPKPPGPEGMEFLDYKTHRKLYNHV